MATLTMNDGPVTAATDIGTPDNGSPSIEPMATSPFAAAIGFALALIVGIPLLTWTWSDSDDASVLAWYADGGHRAQQLAGAVLVVLAGLAFAWFLAGMRDRLDRTGERTLATMMAIMGTVFVACLSIGAAAIAAVSAAVELGDQPVPTDPDVLRVMEGMGFGTLLFFGCVAAAGCIVALSRGAQRASLMPRWLIVGGYVAAALLLFGAVYVPIVALPLWALTLGVWGLVTSRAVP